tara:strand:+ start:2895 stop:3131 length:237 start_codon:yes stop_codon:yes gene_type:complete
MNDEELENRLVSIEKKLDKLIFLAEMELKPECKKMGGHIDFVEKVYENVKAPLGFICNKFRFLRGGYDLHTKPKFIKN